MLEFCEADMGAGATARIEYEIEHDQTSGDET